MITTTITEEKLENLIQKSVRTALMCEIIKLRAFLLPSVSLKEQMEIERYYKKLSHKPAKTIKVKLWTNGR